MRYLLRADETISTLLAEGVLLEASGQPMPERILSKEQLQAHATETGMVVVFVGSPSGAEDEQERQKVSRFIEVAEAALQAEVTALADNYRRMIRETLPSGRNLAVRTALNRVRVQESFLATLDMADQAETCELLRLSKSNPSATLGRKESRGELIRIDRDGRPFYPLFQFDLDAGQVYPVVQELNRLRPAHWSNLRLCYWLARAHADFGRSPAELFGQADAEIINAFRREIEPSIQG